MTPELHPDHPDANCKPGDTREAGGTTWIFGANQFMHFWRARPRDGTVVCSKDYPGFGGPYRADGMGLTKDDSFEYAATTAQKGAKREYEKAKRIVDRYEGKAE